MANRLAGETSPYLVQHKDNPVDWYPWGPEAFAAAKAQDKPIFLSIGYAACHWCHVMAHESFESDEIAALMNELFINVKVDREERPDVDAIYMNAIHVMGEGGGWPLSAFCTSDGRPFFLGTYFPPSNRYGRPGFPDVLRSMARVYAQEREKVMHNVEAVLEGLRHIDEHFRRGAAAAVDAGPGRLDKGLLVTAGRNLAQKSDPRNGGLGSKPKFPSSSAHDLLGRAGRLAFGKPAREAFLLQARKMALGGIYDHLGGGFARYSVDERWLVPHFEKMLYDNAQLLGIYGDAFALTGDPDYRRVIDETVVWLEREMLHSIGGLYASQDADSEGEEGKYYVWLPEEIDAVLGPADAIFFRKAYGVTQRGNFEHGTSVLERVSERGPDSEESALEVMRHKLFVARDKRVHPGTDTKILAGWNGLAVSGLLRAWGATGNERALGLARTVAEFLASRMVHGDGKRIWRVCTDGVFRLEGTVDDYAFVALAFLQMAEATGDAVWWQRGSALAKVICERFYAEQDGVGVFYMTPSDDPEPLIHRPESHSDGAIPSGAAVAVECFLRLGLIAGDERALEIAERYLAGRGPQAVENFFGASRLLAAVDLYVNGVELVVSEGTGRDELFAAARRAYAPTLMIAGSWAAPALLEGRTGPGPGPGPCVSASGGRAQAYVCRGQTCAAPVSEPDALRALLEQEPQLTLFLSSTQGACMRTRICDLFGIEHPIVGFTPSPEVAAAISRAGGLGVLGAIRYSQPEELEQALEWMDENTGGKPYGVDVVIPAGHVEAEDLTKLEGMISDSHRSFVADVLARFGVPGLPEGMDKPAGVLSWMHSRARSQVDIALKHPIKLLANALGSPPRDVIEQAHARGVLVAALAGKREHALGHKEAGVDVIVAQGHEAGGHTGEITTMVLVPEIVDAMGGLPVLAAGGIGTGRQIAAALALGADGVWMGSLWLTTAEYALEPTTASGYSVVKEKLLAATSSDTVRSRVISGKPARMLRTPWTEAWEAKGSPGTLPMPLQGLLVADAEARIRHHQSRELLGTPVGQIVGQMNEVLPVEKVVARLVDELERTVARLGAR